VFFFKDKGDITEKLNNARSWSKTKDGYVMPEKGGYMNKLGQVDKTWKRRWFVLHPDRLEYYKKPNATKPMGVILIKEISAVILIEDDKESVNKFTIWTKWDSYTVKTDNERDREDWIDVIDTARLLYEELVQKSILGKMYIKIIQAADLPNHSLTKTTVDSYCTVKLGNQIMKTDTIPDNTNPQYNSNLFEFDYHGEEVIRLQVHDQGSLMNDKIGEVKVNLKLDQNINNIIELNDWHELSKKNNPNSFGRLEVYLKYIPIYREPGEIIDLKIVQNESIPHEINDGEKIEINDGDQNIEQNTENMEDQSNED